MKGFATPLLCAVFRVCCFGGGVVVAVTDAVVVEEWALAARWFSPSKADQTSPLPPEGERSRDEAVVDGVFSDFERLLVASGLKVEGDCVLKGLCCWMEGFAERVRSLEVAAAVADAAAAAKLDLS